MLSSSRRGLLAVAVLVPGQKKVCSKNLLFSPSHVHPPTRSLFSPVASFSSARSTGGHFFSLLPSSSFSSSSPSKSPSWSVSFTLFRRPGVGQKQQQQQEEEQSKRSYRGRHPVKSSLVVHSISRISSSLKARFSLNYGSSALSSSPLCRSSVMLRRWGVGQQRQRENRRNCRRGQQMKNGLIVEAVASIDDQTTNFNQNPLLREELQRHGVHESDYTSHKVKPQQSEEDRRAHKTTGSSMPRKRKALTAGLTSGGKQQPSSSKDKSGAAVKDWCCYLLLSVDSKKTYVGVTFDIKRRLRQHNGEIAGGAKSARAGRPWRVVCTVQGFKSRSEACQFEWRWKSNAAKIKTIKLQESQTIESPLITRRRATLAKVLELKEDWNDLNVHWHTD